MFATRACRPSPQPMPMVQHGYVAPNTHQQPYVPFVPVPVQAPVFVPGASVHSRSQISQVSEAQGPVHTTQLPNPSPSPNQGPFYTHGPFSSPAKHPGAGDQPPPVVSPPAPPPLFRPGPHTPASKPATTAEAKLNNSEKEDLYR